MVDSGFETFVTSEMIQFSKIISGMGMTSIVRTATIFIIRRYIIKTVYIMVLMCFLFFVKTGSLVLVVRRVVIRRLRRKIFFG